MLYIATLDEIKKALGITDNADNDVLFRHLVGLQGRFDQFCRRRFLYGAADELFDGDVTAIQLARWPVDVLAVAYENLNQEWISGNVVTADKYRVNKARGLVYWELQGQVRWPAGMQNIRVVYTGGFVKSTGVVAPGVDEADLESLRRAFFMQAEFEWRNRKNLGNSSISASGVNISLAPAKFLPDVESVLSGFARI